MKQVSAVVLLPVSIFSFLGGAVLGRSRRNLSMLKPEKPRKITVGGETGVWTGDWTPPLSLEKFLDSTPAQYEVFSRSMRRMAPKVGAFVGSDIDGKKATLSGLLGVGHLAGEAGIEGWVKDPAIRQKFKNTTASFVRTNGVF